MRRAALALLLVALPALAQDVSDLQPKPPGGEGAPYQPGMPIPQAPAQAPTGAAGTGETAPAGRKGYIILDEEDQIDPGEGAPTVTRGDVPATHIVKKGDTLWDLAQKYYGSPWAWPKLWAYNPSITNPHWIYPNDIIRLREGGGERPLTDGGKSPPEGPAEPGAPGTPRGRSLIVLREGFVDAAQLESAGKIVGSKEEKMMLSTRDEAYVEFKKRNFVLGEPYAVYQNVRVVKHPVTNKKLGEVVQIFGDAEIKTVQTDSRIVRMTITDAIDPIERGYKVGPLRRKFEMPAARACDSPMRALIVETMRINRNLIGEGHVLFLDKGKKDNVRLGDRYYVIRRGDGYVPLLSRGPRDDKRFPKEVIAEIVVVEVRDVLSTGIVTASVKESRIGDAAECFTAQ